MSFVLRLSTLLLGLAVLLSTVSARPQFNTVEYIHKRTASPTSTEEHLTNAARMAAGLGPLAPRQLFNPTRVNVARANPSVVTLSGRIKVTRASDGTVLGYLDKNYHATTGRFDLNDNPNAIGSHLTVSFTKPASSSSLFDIFVTSNGNPHHPDLGFAHGSTTLQNSNSDWTVMTGTNPTTPGKPASTVGNGLSSTLPYSESPIWSYDASTGRLTNTWFNPSSPGSSTGVSVSVKTYYSSSKGFLQGRASLSSIATEVFFTLV
ncbi:hypothetical protein M413DRAFT_447787 [Hebeloma cylindrosporum]|uniref:Glycoside hydrolase family 131 protein n=1 Tax=Hebeloma cylindrosporum TaxID=76867 RepID=A0A0C2XLH8_HEBCY|nr:hypothetical protein M413DRAFT_447787 [Hebeloma cylindrosporum h7]